MWCSFTKIYSFALLEGNTIKMWSGAVHGWCHPGRSLMSCLTIALTNGLRRTEFMEPGLPARRMVRASFCPQQVTATNPISTMPAQVASIGHRHRVRRFRASPTASSSVRAARSRAAAASDSGLRCDQLSVIRSDDHQKVRLESYMPLVLRK